MNTTKYNDNGLIKSQSKNPILLKKEENILYFNGIRKSVVHHIILNTVYIYIAA